MEPSKPGSEPAESLESEGSAAETPPPAENGGMVSGDSLEPTTASSQNDTSATEAPKVASEPPPKKGFKRKLAGINIYLLLFILVILIAVMALVVGIQKSRKEANPEEVSTQTLSPDAINQLKGNDVKIGDAKQTLSVESNAVFAGRVLVQGGVDIAGGLKVGGALSLTDVTVSGISNLEKAQINELAVSGNAGIQGQLSVQKTISVTGGGSFGGPITTPQLTVDTLQLTKDLQLNGHIDAGGNTPGHSNGGSIGSGGTSSISGTDIAGSVTISTGSGPSAGCLATVTFSKKYNAVPHVVVSPSSSDAGGLDYYISRNTTSFSICANNPAASKNYSFDYIVID